MKVNNTYSLIPDDRTRRIFSLCTDKSPVKRAAQIVNRAGNNFEPSQEYVRIWKLNQWGIRLTIIDFTSKKYCFYDSAGNEPTSFSDWINFTKNFDEWTNGLEEDFKVPITFSGKRSSGHTSGISTIIVEKTSRIDYKWIFCDINLAGENYYCKLNKKLNSISTNTK